MQAVTLAIGFLGSISVLSLRPAYALAAYIAVLVWYPYFLRISIGTIDISAGRIVVVVLLLRCLCDRRIWGKFVWSQLDTLVTLSMVVYVGIYCITHHPLLAAVENRGGFLMDTWFAYMAGRMIVTDKRTLICFIKTASVVLAPLAILGLIESVTGWRPFFALRRFRPWRTLVVGGPIVGSSRWGLTRAIGPFSHFILFGTCFAMFLPLIWALRHQRGYWGKLAYPFSAIVVVGAFSSMSSGPWSVLIVVILCLTMEKCKRWAKTLLILFICTLAFVHVASSRPFYHVLFDYANPVGGSWYQRAVLIDGAIEDFGDWWLVGYGGKDPDWGRRAGMGHTDTNNEFILAGVKYGILGIIVLGAVLIAAFRGLIHAGRQTTDVELKSLYWSLGCTLSGVIVAWQGVSFFGQMPALFYSILGITGSSSAFAKYATADGGRLLRASTSNFILAHEQDK